MPDQIDPRWNEYYLLTKALPPSQLLKQALDHVETKEKAIDIGSGALKDTRFLLSQGFEVTAIDKEPCPSEIAADFDPTLFHFIQTSFEDFDFPVGEYNLATAMFALPFNPPASFDGVIARIKASLKDGGVFCGQLFGINDEWRSSRPFMKFHGKKEIEYLFSDLEILFLEEEEKDGITASGTPKHWHLFHFIVRK